MFLYFKQAGSLIRGGGIVLPEPIHQSRPDFLLSDPDPNLNLKNFPDPNKKAPNLDTIFDEFLFTV